MSAAGCGVTEGTDCKLCAQLWARGVCTGLTEVLGLAREVPWPLALWGPQMSAKELCGAPMEPLLEVRARASRRSCKGLVLWRIAR